MSQDLNENTKIRMSLLIILLGVLCTSLIWVGSIQADVQKLKEDRLEISKKVDSIKENTDYIRGVIDSERGSK